MKRPKTHSRIMAVVPLDEPSPWGFMNVYNDGDIWQKIRGCDECPSESNCCRNCPLFIKEQGCYLHFVNKGQDKPIHCVIHPSPLKHRAKCILEYKCIRGKYKGFIRRQNDPRNVLRDEETGEKIIID